MRGYDDIDPRCPEVTIRNWRKLNAEGWRWLVNLKADLNEQNELYLFRLQYLHGKTNITLGDAWSELRPLRQPGWVGVYIRDLGEVTGKFIQEFDMWWESLKC